MNYQTHSGDCVPEAVRERFDDPSSWPAHGNVAPDTVPKHIAVYGELYEGFVDGKRQYVSKHGHASRADHFDYVQQLPNGALPRFEGRRPETYRSDINVVHHDHYAEHVTRVTVVTEDGSVSLGSRSGIVWSEHVPGDNIHPSELSDETLETAVALLDHDNSELQCSAAKILGGWHSSMERSEQSELMNALYRGELPPEADDNCYPYYKVKGDTNNVCSVNMSVYGPDALEDVLQPHFENARAAPGHAGFN